MPILPTNSVSMNLQGFDRYDFTFSMQMAKHVLYKDILHINIYVSRQCFEIKKYSSVLSKTTKQCSVW